MHELDLGQIMIGAFHFPLCGERRRVRRIADGNTDEAASRPTERDSHAARIDWVFCLVTIVQLVSISAAATAFCPSRLSSDIDTPGVHVWSVAAVGSLLCIAPTLLAAQYAGRRIVRHAFAVAQVVWSGVIVYLCDGVAVSHLCVIVSLLLLTLYRDYRVLLTASLLAATDYIFRSMLFPQTLYGDRIVIEYQWLEHLNWLLITTGFLCVVCYRRDRRAKRVQVGAMATNTATHRVPSKSSDFGVEQARHNAALQAMVADLVDTLSASDDALEAINALLERIAISVNLLHERSRSSRVNSLANLANTVYDRRSDIADYLTKDSRGKHFPSMFKDLASKLGTEHSDHQCELEAIQEAVEHLKRLVDQSVASRENTLSC
ncbi:MAG: sensory transduction histidine kinase [Rhodopirellula sp. JB044]|uniref:sensory transduction histidine kinase n=1 Tax=Rhodopirellula sp. JB044 TaxID=3342844 RepID=UPI00370B06DE